MKINDQLTLSDIQENFNKTFPFLDIDFFKGSHKNHLLTVNHLPDKTRKIGDYRLHKNEKTITIHSDMSVKELSELFDEIYGLDAKVFRKSGKAWLETVLTEDWTLNEQNLQGKALTELYNDKF